MTREARLRPAEPPGAANRAARAAWGLAWLVFFRASPRPFHAWRRWLLRAFGASLGPGVHVYPSARVWAPWNLRMSAMSCLADYVDCYNVDVVEIGEHAIVSQYSFLCTASHDYAGTSFALVTAPIRIGAHSWVAADVYIGPGVTVGRMAVVGARSSVFGDIPDNCVAVGNPARVIKHRAPAPVPAGIAARAR